MKQIIRSTYLKTVISCKKMSHTIRDVITTKQKTLPGVNFCNKKPLQTIVPRRSVKMYTPNRKNKETWHQRQVHLCLPVEFFQGSPLDQLSGFTNGYILINLQNMITFLKVRKNLRDCSSASVSVVFGSVNRNQWRIREEQNRVWRTTRYLASSVMLIWNIG